MPFTDEDVKKMMERLATLEAAVGAAPSIPGRHSVGGANPRALTLDTKDLELLVLDLEKRVSALEK